MYTGVETPHGKEADELVISKGHGPDDKVWSRQGQVERMGCIRKTLREESKRDVETACVRG